MSNILRCETKLTLNGEEVSSQKVFELVFDKNSQKYKINYGPTVQHLEEYENNELKKIIIKTTDTVCENINGGGIYFILNDKEDKVLYIGKSQKLKDRLKQHLIECNKSTSSHIQDVLDYLLDRQKKGLSLCIKYCVINTGDDKNNAAIEGILLDYIFGSSNRMFEECWNKRKD